jgi:hypothetical protein
VLDGANNTITQITLATGAVGSPVGGSGLLAPDAIAIAPNGKTAYVVDGGSATHAGGLTTVNITGSAPAPAATTAIDASGDHPDAIAISPAGSAAFVVDAPTNGHAASVTPLTLSGTTVTKHASVAVPGAAALYGIAAAPDGGSVYATGTTSGGNVLVPIAISGASATPAAPAALGAEPGGIAIAPDQAPVAALAASSPLAAGEGETLDASASSNPSAPIASYTFDFGDGSTSVTTDAPNASTTHPYSVAGVYTASVTVTDTAGTSTSQVFTGQTLLRNGSSDAVASQQVTVFPTVSSLSPSAGPAGTKVTITGTGFSTKAGATTVAFGGKAASGVSCASSTKCTATAPTGTATVQVTVTVGGQTSPTGPDSQYSYTTGKPTITHIDPNTGPVGTVVTIDGTGFSTASGQTIVRFAGTRSTTVNCSSETECTAVAPGGLQSTTSAPINIYVVVGKQISAAVAADKYRYTK